MSAFQCEVQHQSGGTILRLVGQIGLAEAEEFDRQCRRVAESRPARVVLDMSGLTMLSSAGIGALLRLQKMFASIQCEVRLAALPAEIVQILELSRLTSLFTVAPTVADAMN